MAQHKFPSRPIRHEIALVLAAKVVALAALYFLFFAALPAADFATHLFSTDLRK